MKTPGWFWVVFAVVILVAGLVAGAVMLFVSWNHPSLTADEDYYQQGVEYDAYKAQQARNEALGWQPELEVRRTVTVGVPEVLVSLRLTGSNGDPVEQASVTVESFHLARAGDRFQADLPERSPGEYEAAMPLRRVGIWEFRFVVRKGEDVFTTVVEREF